MMKIVVSLVYVLFLSGAVFAGSSRHENHSDHMSAFYDADPSFKNFASRAYAYIVYPSVAKGAFIVGGAGGDGFVYEQGRLVGTSKLSQVTVGLQIGGQSYREIVLFENQARFNEFKEGNLQLSAQMSGVALSSGGSLNAGYKNGVAIFTVAMQGLMGEISVGAQKFSFVPLR